MAEPSAIVLAAGEGARFGGHKLAALLDGRPILQHVLDALAVAGIDDPVVVLGADADSLVARLTLRRARTVRNANPERGLSSSLQVGWAEAFVGVDPPSSVLVVLGDQPRLDPSVVRSLAAMPADPARPIVVARHADGARNPVRLEPAAAGLVAAATGDRGLGPMIDANPELVRVLEVEAWNPDVDRRSDLVALVEVAHERVAHAFEARCRPTLRLGHLSPSVWRGR